MTLLTLFNIGKLRGNMLAFIKTWGENNFIKLTNFPDFFDTINKKCNMALR